MARSTYRKFTRLQREVKRAKKTRTLYVMVPTKDLDNLLNHNLLLGRILEAVWSWVQTPRYKKTGDHDTFSTYHEGIDTAQGEVYEILERTD